MNSSNCYVFIFLNKLMIGKEMIEKQNQGDFLFFIFLVLFFIR